MKVPTHLSHKPIIAVNNYDQMDGKYAGQTDAMAISIGHSQYDWDEISLKVWRWVKIKSGKRKGKLQWSRMSEEIPIHRNLDLSILFLKSLIELSDKHTETAKRLDLSYMENEGGEPKDALGYYKDEENNKFIKPRMEELRHLLNEWLGDQDL